MSIPCVWWYETCDVEFFDYTVWWYETCDVEFFDYTLCVVWNL